MDETHDVTSTDHSVIHSYASHATCNIMQAFVESNIKESSSNTVCDNISNDKAVGEGLERPCS